ncbi:MAG: VCBS repeat-containing protein [Planctomycetota bacterium]|nr:MAG: VCBS repeat-containing protein [Planctomycetota bacterium]
MQSSKKKRKGSPVLSIGCIPKWMSIFLAVLIVYSVPAMGQQFTPADENPAFYRGGDFGYRNPDWMGRLPDDRLISELSIPGTHETMSKGIHYEDNAVVFPWLICHSMGLITMLEGGIRALDVRCQHDYDHFLIHHGGRDVFALFGEDDPWRDLVQIGTPGWINVLGTCVEFLKEHPTETILMRVVWQVCDEIVLCGAKGVPQNTSRSFAETFAWYRDEAGCTINDQWVPYKDYIWQSDDYTRVPRLGEVRGKIVILQEFLNMFRVGSQHITDTDELDNDNYRVCTADFNGDSYPDLAATMWLDDEIAFLLNKGDGNSTFDRATKYGTGKSPNSVCAADFNGDAHPDLAVTTYNDDHVSIYLNKGDGTGTFWGGRPYWVGTSPREVCAADFNGDSFPDLAIATWNDDHVNIYMNTGDGTGRFHDHRPYWVGTSPRDVCSADFNGDSFPDLAVTTWNDDHVNILMNTGDGTGRFHSVRQPYWVGTSPWMVSSADFNGDSFPDLAVTTWNDDHVNILMNTGDGTGRFHGVRQPYYTGKSPLSVFASDFNGDTFPDLAVTNFSEHSVAVFLNTGDGTGRFNPPISYRPDKEMVGRDPSSVVSADFNNDTHRDLAVVCLERSDNWAFEDYFTYGVAIYPNRGDGTGRFHNYTSFGISWESLLLQDWSQVGSSDYDYKWGLVQAHLDSAMYGRSNEMYFNFLSGSTFSATPSMVAQNINPRCYNYLKSFVDMGVSRRCGVIMADFPGAGLVDAIISLNDFPLDQGSFTPLPYVKLYQNSPNPFNPVTAIRFNLPGREHVKVSVYDVSGRLVRTLINREMDAGLNEIYWDGSNSSGHSVASGVYFCRLVAGEFSETKKMLLLR